MCMTYFLFLELIDTLSKGCCYCMAPQRCKKRQVLWLHVAVAVWQAVLQQVSCEALGGRRQADKILITTKAVQPYLLYRGSYLLTLAHPDNDPFSTGISAPCGGSNLFFFLFSLSLFFCVLLETADINHPCLRKGKDMVIVIWIVDMSAWRINAGRR